MHTHKGENSTFLFTGSIHLRYLLQRCHLWPLMYCHRVTAHPNIFKGCKEWCLSIKRRGDGTLHSLRKWNTRKQIINNNIMWKDKSCDHGNMVQLRHYWSYPYHGLPDTLPNEGFRSPTNTKKTFQILFISNVAFIKKVSIAIVPSFPPCLEHNAYFKTHKFKQETKVRK